MQKLKDLGWGLLGILIPVVGIILFTALIVGGFKVAERIYPYVAIISGIVFLVCLFVLLPLAIFKKTRLYASIGLLISSYIFGLSTWLYGFLIALVLWGIFAVVLGLFIAGIGVVPVAMLAALFKGEWMILINLIFGIFLTFGSRMLAIKLGEMVDKENERNNIIEIESKEIKRNELA